MRHQTDAKNKPRLVWPRFAIAAVVIGIIMAILWMMAAVVRLRSIRIPEGERTVTITNTSAP